MLLPAGAVGLYHASNSALSARHTTLFGAALALGSTVTWSQVLAGLSLLDLRWPDDFKAILKVASLFLFDLDVMQFECLAPVEQLTKYFMSVLAPMVLIGAYFGCFAVSQVLPSDYKMQWSPTVNAAGTIIQVVFIQLVTIAVSPWQKLTQPTGKDSVFKYPSVDFGTGEHGLMMGFGLMLLLGIAVPFLVGSAHVIRNAPERAAEDPSFLRTYRFIFSKYRNECYSFHMYFLLRQFLIALMPAVTPTETPEVGAQTEQGAGREFCRGEERRLRLFFLNTV